jgi:hypothetical protein
MPAVVDRYLAAHVRRHRLAAVARAAGWSVAISSSWALLACIIDRLLPLPPAVRIAAVAVALCGCAGLLARPVVRLFRRFDPVAAAASVERMRPAFAHRLVTLASPGPPSDMRGQLEVEVREVIAATGRARVPRRPAVTAWAAAAFALTVVAGLWRWPWLDLPQLARRLARPTSAVAAVTATRLAVQPGDADVIEGRSIVIRALATRLSSPDAVTLHASDDGGHTWVDRPMSPAGDGSTATLNDVDADVRYFVTAGDAVSPTYALRLHRVPGMVSMRVRLDYPSALKRPPRTADVTDGVILAPVGTTVTLTLTATIPLRRATLVVGPDRIETSATADPAVRRATLVVRRDARFAVEMTAADGTMGGGPPAGRVHVERDPPGVAPDDEIR